LVEVLVLLADFVAGFDVVFDVDFGVGLAVGFDVAFAAPALAKDESDSVNTRSVVAALLTYYST